MIPFDQKFSLENIHINLKGNIGCGFGYGYNVTTILLTELGCFYTPGNQSKQEREKRSDYFTNNKPKKMQAQYEDS